MAAVGGTSSKGLMKRRESIRRVWSRDSLPMVRFWFHGPRWRSRCNVVSTPLADINPAAVKYHKPGKMLLVTTLEDEVRERICEELRPDVFAEWTDPRERFALDI